MNRIDPHLFKKAQAAARKLTDRGVPVQYTPEIVAVVYQTLTEEHRRLMDGDRRQIAADWLCDQLPAEVVCRAAERAISRRY